MGVITAKFGGTCKRCHRRINPGEQINYLGKGQGVTCADECAAKPAPEGPANSDLERVVNYLRTRSDEDNLDPFGYSLLRQYDERGFLTPKQISANVDKRLDAPGHEDLPSPEEVPAGRYAIVLEHDGVKHDFLVRVWRGTRNPHYVRCYEYDGGGEVEKIDALRRIAEAGPRDAALRFGQLRGRCARCDHRLKDRLSVELSIGPVCMKYWWSKSEQTERKAQARSAIRARGEDPNAPATATGPDQLELEAA